MSAAVETPRNLMTTEASDARSHEKTAVAGLSALAATGLTVGKLIVGLMTGSIAILSEAAHSGLDLLASLITFLAVRVASQPPDELHPYGHQKAENVAAYTEMLFLLGTCTWITIEATKRLLHWHGESVVKLSVWAYAMVAVSICVDWWRSTALIRAARKHSSQALEADALHFRADLWSSCVVLTGLAVMGLGRRFFPHLSPVLDHADSMAALGVVLLVLNAALRLGRRTVNVLLDGAPGSLNATIRDAVEGMEGVIGIRQMRARQVGDKTFVELAIAVCRTASFEVSHDVTQQVSDRIRQLASNADVIVHAHPTQCNHETAASRIRALAESSRVNVHHLTVHEASERLYVDMDIEVEEDQTLGEAHRHVSEFEDLVRGDLPEVAQLNSRIEPRPAPMTEATDVTSDASDIVRTVREVVAQVPGISTCHNIKVREQGDRLFISAHCLCAPTTPVGEAHRAAARVEEKLHAALPSLERVLVHTEPARA